MRAFKRFMALFLSLLCVFLLCNAVLRPKDDESLVVADDFARQPKNSIDLLFLGSSRAIMNINPAEIYLQTGVASYVYGATGQPIWSSYFYLKEALNTQKPKVVALEMGMTSFAEEYAEYKFVVKNNLGLRNPFNKIHSAFVSVPEKLRTDIILGFPVYHNRYEELTLADITLGLVNPTVCYKGYTPSSNVVAVEKGDDKSAQTPFEIPPKNLQYLQKIADLCREKNIQLVLFATPDAISEVTQWSDMCASIELAVGEFALKNNIEFISLDNQDKEIGLDYSADFRDERHLNIIGSAKTSRYLGSMLATKYSIPRVSEKYKQHWQQWAQETHKELIGE